MYNLASELSTIIGKVNSIEPIRSGLSGAQVSAVSAASGEYVLKSQPHETDDNFWSQYRLILKRASEHQIAPEVVYIDDAARAVLSVRVHGVPLQVALRGEARDAAIASVLAQIRAVHAIDPAGITERNPLDYARAIWEAQRQRPDFPSWAKAAEREFADVASALERDPRRVVSHNDVNPGNILWDGTRAWIVDWDAAALGHPYYDFATFATFLDLNAEAGWDLMAQQQQSPLDDDARATFTALRRLVALAIGYSFVSGVPDVASLAPTRADAPTLAECRAALRSGALDLQTVEGRGRYGFAMLRAGISS